MWHSKNISDNPSPYLDQIDERNLASIKKEISGIFKIKTALFSTILKLNEKTIPPQPLQNAEINAELIKKYHDSIQVLHELNELSKYYLVLSGLIKKDEFGWILKSFETQLLNRGIEDETLFITVNAEFILIKENPEGQNFKTIKQLNEKRLMQFRHSVTQYFHKNQFKILITNCQLNTKNQTVRFLIQIIPD